MHERSLEISFPVLNEEWQLEASVRRTLDFCDSHDLRNVHFTIADNGSTDGTEAIGRRLAAEFDNVDYLRLDQRGVGLALKASWARSRCDFVGYMDIDLATDLQHLVEVYRLVQEGRVEVINGSRLLPGSKVMNRSTVREISSRVFNFLLRRVLGASLTDGMCGFKFMTRENFDQLMATFAFTDQWFFNAEIIVKSEFLGRRVHEIPVSWTDDPNSKIRLVHHTTQFLKDIARVKLEHRRLRRLGA